MANPNLELILLIKDTMPGVCGGVQTGKGSAGKPRSIETMSGGDWKVTISAGLKDGKMPFYGPEIQSDSKGKFFYICWGGQVAGIGFRISRRAKIYLSSISQSLVDEALASNSPLNAVISGRAKDGLPCCATVPFLADWHIDC